MSKPPPPDAQTRRALAWLVTSALIILCCGGAWHNLVVRTSTILIFRDDPASRVFVNGKEVQFDEGKYTIEPWDQTYQVEVHSPTLGVHKRTIYPHSEGSDSGTISVEKEEIGFHMACSPQPCIIGNPKTTESNSSESLERDSP